MWGSLGLVEGLFLRELQRVVLLWGSLGLVGWLFLRVLKWFALG